MGPKHTVLITGAAGYVGGMLVRAIASRADVEWVIGLDKESLPDFIQGEQKLIYIQMNTADEWEAEVRKYTPDIVIHTAWQIREIYGNRALSWKWNIDGSEKVFRFAFTERQVKRLIHYSTVASYGAFPENTTEHRYIESEPFRKTDYLYAEEKRIAEERLEAAYKTRTNAATVAIIRPAAITGPRGRFMRIRFGLQSALSGSLKGQKSFFYDLISAMVSWVPVTPTWLRQYAHEDDIVAVTLKLAFDEVSVKYEAFNIAPPGAAVYGADMAKAVGKRTVSVPPWLIRIAFWFMWHLSRGKVPTSEGSWKGYSYPIAVDGSKATRLLGFKYSTESLDAFYYTNGTYESEVPETSRRHKS
jgi:nucleoside-diphosphate-sugar epimerase